MPSSSHLLYLAAGVAVGFFLLPMLLQMFRKG